MDSATLNDLTVQWENLCKRYDASDVLDAFQFIQQHAGVLVYEFYKKMLDEKESAEFFSDDLIQQRLQNTLHQWLLESFGVAIKQNYLEAVEKQKLVGHVHARVGIPSWLIIRGVREIEKKIFQIAAEQQTKNNTLSMIGYIVELLSFSTEIMCRSYEEKTEVHQEAKHSYRLFSAMQDVSVQKDKQRSSLLDWENELIFKAFSLPENIFHSLLSKSEFGLWFIHKASYAFTGSEQVKVIINIIGEVDVLVENIRNSENKANIYQFIQDVRQKNREIQHLLDQLFQVADYIEMGNDSLTKLLNRRYLDTVVSREIELARKNSSPLCLLAIDADYFKSVNDRFGHTAGDIALKYIAETLMKYSKGSDYAFRVGGEEFLVLLVDTDLARSKVIAESIRQGIEASVLYTADNVAFNFTVSIGVQPFAGHLDYQKFLDAADLSLYAAKNLGRNRVSVAQVELTELY